MSYGGIPEMTPVWLLIQIRKYLIFHFQITSNIIGLKKAYSTTTSYSTVQNDLYQFQ